MSVKENILRISNDISSICKKFARDPKEITLLAVIKQAEVGQIKEAVDSGLFSLGGNKVQDTLKKYQALSDEHCLIDSVSWHMIGHLQTNKVKIAVEIFGLIHSVDSLRLAEQINKQAKKKDKIQNVLIEVNLSAESAKYGVTEKEALDLAQHILSMDNMRLKGLMTMAPFSDNCEESRKYFKALRLLRDRINNCLVEKHHLRLDLSLKGITKVYPPRLDVLSMGMTQDYGVGIEEGSTIVRLGRAIFK